MTNKELVTELSEHLGWTQVRVSEVLADAIEIMSSKLAEDSSISISNFGVFQTRKRAERISVNPQTKERFLVPPKITVAFKPAIYIKEKYK